jgi:hypothetical protein
MKSLLLPSVLLAFVVLPSCADSNSFTTPTATGPEEPINPPDPGVFNPGGSGGSNPTSNNNTGASTNGGGNTSGGGGGSSGGGGGNGGGGNGGGGNGGGGNGGGGNGGGGGGAPVPEPSTLILFGSGLAGMGASLLRRRKKQQPNKD